MSKYKIDVIRFRTVIYGNRYTCEVKVDVCMEKGGMNKKNGENLEWNVKYQPWHVSRIYLHRAVVAICANYELGAFLQTFTSARLLINAPISAVTSFISWHVQVFSLALTKRISLVWDSIYYKYQKPPWQLLITLSMFASSLFPFWCKVEGGYILIWKVFAFQ